MKPKTRTQRLNPSHPLQTATTRLLEQVVRRIREIPYEIIRYIAVLFLSTRLFLTFVGLISRRFIPLGQGKHIIWSDRTWLDLWGVWDSAWYMDIAQNGYDLVGPGSSVLDKTNFPFFPLYPLLMQWLSPLMGGSHYLAGLLISNGCLLGSAYLLYRLVERDASYEMARRSVKYLFLYPVAFILSGVFTESLYLFLTLFSYYMAKRQRWALAGVAGLLLSATRPLGVLVILPLLVIYWQQPNVQPGNSRLRSSEYEPRRLQWNSLWLLLVPLGLLGFCVFNYWATGDFFFFKSNQAAWDRELAGPVVVLWEALKVGLGEPSFKKLLEITFAVSALSALTLYYKRIGLAYWLLGIYSILIPLATGIASQPRFTLVVFPLFMILAMMSQRQPWDRVLTGFLLALQGGLMVFWCTGYGLVI